MTTIAQRCIEGFETPTKFDNEIISLLTPNINCLQDHADKFVFEEPLYKVLTEMIDEEQISMEMVMRHVKMPSKYLWIEWREFSEYKKDMDLGILLSAMPNGLMRGYLIGSPKHFEVKPQVIIVFEVEPPPYVETKNKFTILYTMNDSDSRDRWHSVIQMASSVSCFAMFLVQQPKIIVEKEIKHDAKLQKSRTKNKKKELLDYRRIHMKFGVLGSRVGVIRGQQTNGSSSVPGHTSKRKYHHVLGHFREYHRNTPEAKLIWVEGYFRGDATLGVLIRDRVLTQSKGENT